MKYFFYFCLSYLAFAVLVAFLVRGDEFEPLGNVWRSTLQMVPSLSKFALGAVLTVFVLLAISRVGSLKLKIEAVLLAFAGTLILQVAFSLAKSSLPFIVPFYADPFLIRLDSVLHFGVDPWIFTHWLSGFLPMDRLYPVYLQVWGLPVLGLPLLIAATDNDVARSQRTIVLYLITWLVVGNAFALLGMSVGPIYVDRLFGETRFEDLTLSLQASGFSSTLLGHIQNDLWTIYAKHGQAFGSGISAYPSVHVALATVTAIYMAERSRWLLPVGVLFVAIILFLSVYSGYHYAVDGYFSIGFILLCWSWLKGREPSSATLNPLD